MREVARRSRDGGSDDQYLYYDHSNVKLARKMRKEMTPWESKLWFQFLRAYPIRFQRQKPIGHFVVDFYCAKAKLVIELDGGGHYNPISKENDRKRTEEIENCGLMVLRFCNLDIDRNFYGVCSVIDETVKMRTHGIPPSLREVAER